MGNSTRESSPSRGECGSPSLSAHLAALIESSQDLIWSVDLEFRLVAFNHAFAQALPEHSVRTGMTPSDMAPQSQAACWLLMYERALDEGTYCTKYLLSDGRWLQLSFNRMLQDGDPIGISVFGKDITDRKPAEEFHAGSEKRLRESEARFRSYFSLPLTGMAMTSPQKRLIAVNDRLCQIMGYSREELLRLDLARLTHPDDLRGNVDQFERMAAGELDGYSLDMRFIRKDGSIVWTTICAASVRKPDGTLDYACLNVQDISERSRADEALQASESRFRMLVESAPAAICITRSGLLLYVNRRFAALFGCSHPEECVNRSIDDRFDPETRERVLELRRLYVAGEIRQATLEGTAVRLDGSTFPLHAELRVVRLHDGEAVLSFLEDVTERKAAEEAIRNQIREIQLLSEMNSALLHTTTEEDLLREYCRIVVETGGYRMAWVGFADPGPEKRVIPVAHYGFDHGYLQT